MKHKPKQLWLVLSATSLALERVTAAAALMELAILAARNLSAMQPLPKMQLRKHQVVSELVLNQLQPHNGMSVVRLPLKITAAVIKRLMVLI